MLFGPSPHGLSEIECWHLLSAGGIGRLAVTISALPRIVPVRFTLDFTLDDDRVILCLGDQEELADAVDNTVVVLAVDSLADDSPHGWLVEVNGIAQLAPAHDPAPGCPHQTRPLMASITSALVSGSTYRLCDGALPATADRIEP